MFENTSKIVKNKWARMVGSNSTNDEGKRYVEHIYQDLQENKIFNKSKKLLQETKNPNWNIEQSVQQLEAMDQLITHAIIRAELKTCKLKEPILWTPAIEQSNLLIQYWNIQVKTRRKGIWATNRTKEILWKMNETSIYKIQKMTSHFQRHLSKHSNNIRNSQRLTIRINKITYKVR
jgi:hypothetical protein